MKAMVLAAGLGTRLRPLTDDRPKALVEVAGRTLLEITLSRLREFGIREVIVNVHHFADMVIDYLKANHNFGMHIEVSREDILLDTGGGLKKAAWFFEREIRQRGRRRSFCTTWTSSAPSIFSAWCSFTRRTRRWPRWRSRNGQTSRYLLFDEQLQLCGRRSGERRERRNWFDPSQQTAGAGVFRHPRHLSADLSHADGRRRFLHCPGLSASGGPGRKNHRLPRR